MAPMLRLHDSPSYGKIPSASPIFSNNCTSVIVFLSWAPRNEVAGSWLKLISKYTAFNIS